MRRIVVGVVGVIATAVSSLPLGVAPAAAAAPVVSASVSSTRAVRLPALTLTPAKAITGEKVRATGRLSTAPRRPVQLQRLVGVRWRTIASGRTSRTGSFALATTTPSGSRASLRAVAPRVRISGKWRPAVTTSTRTLTVLAQSGALSLPTDAFVGKEIDGSARFVPARPGRAVALQQQSGSTWTTIASGVEDGSGTAVFRLAGNQPGTFSYRAVAAARAGAAAATTASRQVVVAPDPTVISENAKPLSADEADAVTSFDPATGDLVLGAGAPDGLAGVSPGKVLVIPPRDGLSSGGLRRVISISDSDDGTVLHTEAASLTDLVANVPGDAADIAMTPVGEPVVTDVADGVTVGPDPQPIAARSMLRSAQPAALAATTDLDGKPLEVKVELSKTFGSKAAGVTFDVSGAMSLTPTVQLGLDTDWGHLRSYRLAAGLKNDQHLKASVDAKVSQSYEMSLFHVSTTYAGSIGTVPVWGTLSGDVRLEVSAEGSVSTSVSWTRSGTELVGVQGTGDDLGPHPFHERAATNATLARVAAAGSLTGGVYGSLQLDLYSVGGPFVDAGLEARGSISQSNDGAGFQCDLSYGPRLSIGLRSSAVLKTWIDKAVELAKYDVPLAQTHVLTCPPPQVGDGPPVITTVSLEAATTGTYYSQRLQLNDERDGAWSVAPGDLPAGLTLTSSGLLSGTPTWPTNGDLVTVRFTDARDRTATQVLDLEVLQNTDSTLTWKDAGQTMGLAGAAYRDYNSGAWILTESYTLPAGAGYTIPSTVVVPEGITLTVPQDARLKVGHCYWTIWLPAGPCLSVLGHLEMSGSADHPVIVTKYADDSVGGDADGIDESQSMQGWAPLSIGSGGSVSATGVDFRFAGITASDAADVDLQAVKFRSGAGLSVNAHSVTLDGSRFTGSAGTFTVDSPDGHVTDNRFESTTGYPGVRIRGTTEVRGNEFAAGVVDLPTAGATFVGNRVVSPSVKVQTTAEGASGTFTGNSSSTGGPMVLSVVDGTLSGDVSWTSPVTYKLEANLRIPSGASLTWGPGVVVKTWYAYSVFGSSNSIQVDGSLRAEGTSEQPVVVTTVNDTSVGADTTEPPGTRIDGTSWQGIRTGENATVVLDHTRIAGAQQALNLEAGPNVSATLRHVRIEANGYGAAAVSSSSEDLVVEDSVLVGGGDLLRVNAGDARVTSTEVRGGQLRSSSPRATFHDVSLTQGATFRVDPMGATADITGLTTDTGQPPVALVDAGAVAGDVSWSAAATWLLQDGVTVPAGSSLTLRPGTVVKGRTGHNVYQSFPSYFQVEGTLHASGTASAPVVLTAFDDTTAGGDTSLPTGGYTDGSRWGGIRVGDTGVVTLERTRLAGVGERVTLGVDAHLTVTDSAIENTHGVHLLLVSAGDHLDVERSTLGSDTGPEAMLLQVSGHPVLRDNTWRRAGLVVAAGDPVVIGNRFTKATFPLLSNQSGGPVLAEGNWWGHAGAPVLAGDGADVSGEVDADPWCTNSDCSTLSVG